MPVMDKKRSEVLAHKVYERLLKEGFIPTFIGKRYVIARIAEELRHFDLSPAGSGKDEVSKDVP